MSFGRMPIVISHADLSINEGESFDVGELLNAIGRTVTVIGEVVEVIAVSSGALAMKNRWSCLRLGNVL